MRHTWRLIYTTTLTGAATGAGVVLHGLARSATTEAVAGLALLFTTLIAFRMAWEHQYLRRTRIALSRQELLLEAERGDLERRSDRERTRLRDRERELVEMRRKELAEVDQHLTDERATLQAEFEAKAFDLKCEGVAIGYQLAVNGVDDNAPGAEIYFLPLQQAGRTKMGSGNLNN